MSRLAVFTLVAALVATAVLVPASAGAAPIGPSGAGAVVRALTLHDGNGDIDVQVRQPADRQLVTVLVDIPAGSGRWSGRSVDTGGARCTPGSGPDLAYVCRASDGA